MLLLAYSACSLFKSRQFEPEVILVAVGWVPAFFPVLPRRGGVARRAGTARRSRHGVAFSSSGMPQKLNDVCVRGSDRPGSVDKEQLRSYVQVLVMLGDADFNAFFHLLGINSKIVD